jgi:hypothetical protein
MELHDGSAVDPRQYAHRSGQGNAEYRLAPGLERASQAFRAGVPATAKLLIGIAPIPRSFAPPNYSKTYQDMLTQWGQWMKADAVLTNLPPTLSDLLFASTTHLNAAGAKHFTRTLATSLKPHIETNR